MSSSDSPAIPIAALREFISGRAHYCPTCPTGDQIAYVEADELETFVAEYDPGRDPLRVHAEALADALEDMLTAEPSDEIRQRAWEAWQTYVEWSDRPPTTEPRR